MNPHRISRGTPANHQLRTHLKSSFLEKNLYFKHMRYLLFIILSAISLFLYQCQPNEKSMDAAIHEETHALPSPVQRDLAQIREEGVLRVLMGFSSTNYFLYRGRPRGFEYELIKRLADTLKLKLEIIQSKNIGDMFHRLNRGDVDIVAHGLTITQSRLESIDFTQHHTLTHQVLVQRKPRDWRNMKLHQIERKMIRNVVDLIGKPVFIRKNSSYYKRLIHLSEEIGGEIDIRMVSDNLSTEELIRQVATGKLQYTVADENIANLAATWQSNIDVRTKVSFPQRVGWALRKNSPELKQFLNAWLKWIRRRPTYNVLYTRYFEDFKGHRYRMASEYNSVTGGKLSPYDSLFRMYSDTIQWDWRLLASMAYQESRFNSRERSWAGAMGLMQMMPATAERYGVEDLNDPEANLKGAVQHIQYLQKLWSSIHKRERLFFVLASYNAGEGHVLDAQRLARKFNKDDLMWDGHVAEMILKKSEPKFYNDSIVKYGYCRGEEPYKYVREIMERFQHYKNHVPLNPLGTDSTKVL